MKAPVTVDEGALLKRKNLQNSEFLTVPFGWINRGEARGIAEDRKIF